MLAATGVCPCHALARLLIVSPAATGAVVSGAAGRWRWVTDIRRSWPALPAGRGRRPGALRRRCVLPDSPLPSSPRSAHAPAPAQSGQGRTSSAGLSGCPESKAPTCGEKKPQAGADVPRRDQPRDTSNKIWRRSQRAKLKPPPRRACQGAATERRPADENVQLASRLPSPAAVWKPRHRLPSPNPRTTATLPAPAVPHTANA